MPVFKPCQKSSARPILRPADEGDTAAYDRQRESQATAKIYAQERVRALGLDMKVSLVEFSLSGKKATFYFTSDGRGVFCWAVADVGRAAAATTRHAVRRTLGIPSAYAPLARIVRTPNTGAIRPLPSAWNRTVTLDFPRVASTGIA